ncbi:MAG: hypothetical protein K2V38_08055 [Gemmataceae bacterium]|nr:hypothetical protein [Gemmataceae bacterium]
MDKLPWWGYVVLAGLAWGTYVPIIFYGGTELSTKPGTTGGRLASILCVGVAYFVLAVVVPVLLMSVGGEGAAPNWKTNGLIFSGLAGVMGAVGAICVIFASKAAVDTAQAEPAFAALKAKLADAEEKVKAGGPEADAAETEVKAAKEEMTKYAAQYRIYIAPLIFALAPFINTVLSLIWHPKPGDPWHFGFELPSWHLPLGIALVAVGTFLVLYSKEAAELDKAAKRAAMGPAKPVGPKPQ